MNYARYEALEYYEFRRRGSSNRKDVIIKGVYRLDPFTTPLHMLSLIVNQLTKYRYINTPTLKALLVRTLYDNIVHTLIKTGGGRRARVAKFIEGEGLIKLLGLDREKFSLLTMHIEG